MRKANIVVRVRVRVIAISQNISQEVKPDRRRVLRVDNAHKHATKTVATWLKDKK